MKPTVEYLPSTEQIKKGVNTCTPTEYQNSKTSSNRASKPIQAAVARLWQRCNEIMGAKFTNQYGEIGGDAYHTWCNLLADLSVQQIAHGWKKFMQSTDTFLDAKTFREFCLDNQDRKHKANWAAYKPYEPHRHIEDMGAMERSKKAGREALQRIRGALV